MIERTTHAVAVAATTFVLVFAGACSTPQTGANKAPGGAVENSPVQAEGDRNALFTINGAPVDGRELRLFLEALFPGEEQAGKEGLAGSTDTFINNRLLATMAAKEGIDRSGSVRSRLETRLNHLWRDAYWLDVVKPSVRVADEDLLKGAPVFTPMVSLQQLLVNSRTEAEDLRKRALSGEDFGEIVKAHSVGLTAKNGGLVGFVKEDSPMYQPELLKNMFALKPGEYSPVTETQVGFAVIRVLEKKTAEQIRKEWFASNRERLVRDREKEAWERALDRLVKAHKVVPNRKVIGAFEKARETKASLEPLMPKTIVTVDGVPLTVADVTDPSGMGVVHGNQAIEQIIDKRVENIAIARDMEKRNLKEKHPDISLKEKLLRENIVARSYIDYLCRDIRVTEAELKRLYEENRERFAFARALDVSLIETKSTSRLEDIYKELGNGVPFEEVAERWSDNKNLKGGKLGLVEEGKITPEFAPVKGLRAGQYAKEPIRLRSKEEGVDLYVIPKVNAIREKGILPYGKVDRAGLEKALVARKREAIIANVLKELKEANRVTFTPEYDKFAATSIRHTNKQGEKK